MYQYTVARGIPTRGLQDALDEYGQKGWFLSQMAAEGEAFRTYTLVFHRYMEVSDAGVSEPAAE